MNIVLYTSSFLPRIGGRELVIHYLADALQKLGHTVRVIGPMGWLQTRKLQFDYPVYAYPLLGKNFPTAIRMTQLSLDLVFRGCDVLHAHITYPAGYLGARLKKFTKTPLVITPHGADVHVIPEIGHGKRLDPLIEPKIAYALRNADALTAISDSVRASLMEAGAPAEKIVNVPNGVDLDRFASGVPAQARRWLNLPEAAKILVAVGNYQPRKGHEILVRAMPRILESVPEARLVIVGRNNDTLLPMINELQLQDKVYCPGQVAFPATVGQHAASGATETDDLLAALYASAHLYLSAGINEGSEGLSLALLEAMAAGLPVIASDISGNRDVITQGENGILAKPGDIDALSKAVITLLGSDDHRQEMGRKAKAVASAFSWEAIARQYLSVYSLVSQ